MVPQDDQFNETTLAALWTYLEAAAGTNLGYSLTANPGNFTAHVKQQSQSDQVINFTRLVQDTINPAYFVVAGITQGNVSQVGQEAGILIEESNSTFIFYCLSWQSDGLHLRAYSAYGGAPGVILDVALPTQIDVMLRVENFGGFFNFSWKRYTDTAWTAVGSPFASTFYGSGAGTGRKVGLAAVAGNAGAAAFDYLVDFFTYHLLDAYVVNGAITLQVTNVKQTNGAMALAVRTYPLVSYFEVLPHQDALINTLRWDLQSLEQPFILKADDGSLFQIQVDDSGALSLLPVASGTPQTLVLGVTGGGFVAVTVENVGGNGRFVVTAAPGPGVPNLVLTSISAASMWLLEIDEDGALEATQPVYTLSGITIVRKEGSYPTSITDGTVVVSLAPLTTKTYQDGPIPSRARQYYAAFAVYSAKTQVPAVDATMPIFVNLYKNVGSRFSRVFLSIFWSLLYSLSRLLQNFVDVDMPQAMAQFNINTASGTFLALWGKILGASRYATDTDQVYANRAVSRVMTPRLITTTIINALLQLPGVVACSIHDGSVPSLVIGYSFLGYAGTSTTDVYSDYVKISVVDSPFFFLVLLTLKQNANLAQIIKTIDENKAAGVQYAVQVLETVS